MIETIAVVVGVIALVFIYAATRSGSFRIQRSAVIAAPPEKIFARIDDLHAWASWSPWENIDPALKRSYSGAASGRGAAYAWEGNSKVGSGRMEIVESSAPARIAIKLDFFRPFEAHNTAEFTFEARGGSTTVTWAMFGPRPFISKLMGLVFNMDRMVGGQFEQGLAKLKTLTEK